MEEAGNQLRRAIELDKALRKLALGDEDLKGDFRAWEHLLRILRMNK
jgi:hypothetical protein